MSADRRRTSPEDAQRIAAHARQHLACPDCGAGAGTPCTGPGNGRAVCRNRYIAAAIAIRQQARAARQTPEQAAVLASLPRVTLEEIEAARSPSGGWTKATLAGWGIPWPPPAGWRQALLRGDDGAPGEGPGLTAETMTALRNYDWLVRSRGLDDVHLDWDMDTLVYGDGGALIQELTRPGFTRATEPATTLSATPRTTSS